MTLNEVHNGRSIKEVIELLDKYGKDAKIIAGGTDIVIALRNGKISPKILIDITKIEELKTIEEEGDYISIGGAVTFTQIVESPIFQGNLYGLLKACRMVGSPQIRNKGTIGGNIANGSVAADSIPPLICLESIVILRNSTGIREVLLEDYYNNPIKEDELIVKVRFKKPQKNQILTFTKLGLRKALAISRITMSTFIEFDDSGVIKYIKVASGSLGKYPMRELEVEEFLLGRKLDEENIDKSVEVLQMTMDERLKGRSTLEYKRTAVESMIREAIEAGLKFMDGVNL